MERIINRKKLGRLAIYLLVLAGFFLFPSSLSSDNFDPLGVYFQNVAEERRENEKPKLTENKDKEPKTIVQDGLLGERYEYEILIK